MTRLCLVRISANRREIVRFIRLPIGDNGKCYMPHTTYMRWCHELGVQRGDTVSIG